MEKLKTSQIRKAKIIYFEFVITRESAIITYAETQRQAEKRGSFVVERENGFVCVLIGS